MIELKFLYENLVTCKSFIEETAEQVTQARGCSIVCMENFHFL